MGSLISVRIGISVCVRGKKIRDDTCRANETYYTAYHTLCPAFCMLIPSQTTRDKSARTSDTSNFSKIHAHRQVAFVLQRLHPGFVVHKQQLEKGKPSERVGRKTAGLSPAWGGIRQQVAKRMQHRYVLVFAGLKEKSAVGVL